MRTRIFSFVFCVAVLSAAVGHSTPYFLLDTPADWHDALRIPPDGCISPVNPSLWDDYMANNPAFYPGSGEGLYGEVPMVYSTPELYVWEGGGGGGDEPEDAGLVMAWGEPSTSTGYTGAWQYDYTLDPNLIGTTLVCNVLPPQVGGMGQVTSVGLGLVDNAGFIRSWTWNCGAQVGPGTIAWNTLWNLSIGAVTPLGPDPAWATDGVNWVVPAYFSHAQFSPANVLSIIAIESGQVVGTMIPPGGPGPLPVLWNFWGGAGVVPEPGTAGLLICAALGLLRRRRRASE
ncbi:MAG: PEP-CTERM sorting domain-containing protein [Lentisphaeria bacterium]|nr:PEP-CTERM sorting domain-containing protein [Lentisphaeria bacterium]